MAKFRGMKHDGRTYPGTLVPCDSCDGCGQVTNTARRIPWVWHTRELKLEDGTHLFSEAQPVTCNKCKGTGTIRFDQSRKFFDKRKYA